MRLILLTLFSLRAATSPCTGLSAVIVVQTDSHRLWLCENGESAGDYGVSLGRGGVGKTREGDGKTPLGSYALGAPRPSESFHLFIPIGYPTAEQRKQGLTGADVGIHGPWRGLGIFGWLASWDWTAGCIAVNSKSKLKTIANWITRTQAHTIQIR